MSVHHLRNVIFNECLSYEKNVLSSVDTHTTHSTQAQSIIAWISDPSEKESNHKGVPAAEARPVSVVGGASRSALSPTHPALQSSLTPCSER